MSAPKFDTAKFREALDQVRAIHGVQWKHVAEKTGVSTSTLSRMAAGRTPDAASVAALCAWAGLDHRRFSITQPETSMPADNLMSSLREMITADVQRAIAASEGDIESASVYGAQYSRHETVVREELARLYQLAGSYKAPPRFK